MDAIQVLRDVQDEIVTNTIDVDEDIKEIIHNHVGDEYLTGRKVNIQDQSWDYIELKLTKPGKDFLRLNSLTLKDIDNSYGKNSIREWLIKPVIVAIITTAITTPVSGFIGFYVGKSMTEKPAEQSKAGQLKPKDNPQISQQSE